MIYLASVPEGSIVPFREIGRSMEIPQDFLAKILKTLVNAGIVNSVRGARGGYRLARSAHDISFLDVIEAVEGPVALNTCLSESGKDSVASLPPAPCIRSGSKGRRACSRSTATRASTRSP